MNFFGYDVSFIKKDTKKKEQEIVKSFVAPEANDGAEVIDAGGANSYVQDFSLKWTNDEELINNYRNMALYSDVDNAVHDIVNDAITFDVEEKSVEVNLDNAKGISQSIKKKIKEEFEEVLNLLNFNKEGDDLFRMWYVDGRQYRHIILHENPSDGIQECRYIDPRRIKKVRELIKEKSDTGAEMIIGVEEYYIYKDMNSKGQEQHLRIDPQAIVYTHSGLVDPKTKAVISFLHQAYRSYNQLRSTEDSIVIYRQSRAPERRVFYVDVGKLPKTKAEQYLNNIIAKYKNKMVYDVNTGAVKDTTAHRSMLEDIWLPRREGSRGTEVDTLDGGQNLGDLEDVTYFLKKLYKALHIPLGRLEQETAFNLGQNSEITRDEIKFAKFIEKLRKKFSQLFYELLRTQLILKNIITEDDWEDIKEQMFFDFNSDSHFVELKETEILGNRARMLAEVDEFVGKYYSKPWVQKNILRMSEDEIEQIDKENEEAEAAGELEGDGDEEGEGKPSTFSGGDTEPADEPAEMGSDEDDKEKPEKDEEK